MQPADFLKNRYSEVDESFNDAIKTPHHQNGMSTKACHHQRRSLF